MSVYKTVFEIEKEIKQAQNYLQMADNFYSKQQSRGSPTKAEYDYIKRLVDDGQPVVLTKQIKKALKIRDDVAIFEKAMKEDLQNAGYKKNEIKRLQEDDEQAPVEEDLSDEDSADRRKRKALEQVKGPGAIQEKIKHVTKKEKARLAYRAERERQKLLRP